MREVVAVVAAVVESLEKFLASVKSPFNFEVHFHLVSQLLCVYGEAMLTIYLTRACQILDYLIRLRYLVDLSIWCESLK